jgi:hypothetical protein
MNNIYYYTIKDDKPFLTVSQFKNGFFTGMKSYYKKSEIEKHFKELNTKDILICPNTPYCEKAINDSLLSFVFGDDVFSNNVSDYCIKSTNHQFFLRIIKDILVCFNSVFPTDESRKATKDLLKIVNTKEAYDLNNPFKGINEILSNYDLVKLNRTNLNGTGDID